MIDKISLVYGLLPEPMLTKFHGIITRKKSRHQ